jgi:ABC-type phosphate transport system substrate-binding protein
VAATRLEHPGLGRIARRLILGWLALASFGPAIAAAENWAIVVHPSRSESVTITDVAQIYLKQRRFWRDGTVIVPVNRDAGSAARESFAEVVFHSDPASHRPYWNRQYFQGVLPPITLASSQAVLRFVASEPRAIGYLPERLVDASVHVVARYEGGPD